jgi:hypothetical protein
LQLGAAHWDCGHRRRAAAAAQRLRCREGPPRRMEVGHRDYMVLLIWLVLGNANSSSVSSVAYLCPYYWGPAVGSTICSLSVTRSRLVALWVWGHAWILERLAKAFGNMLARAVCAIGG